MPPTAFVYRFGVFELDPASRRLMSGRERVRLTESQFAILLHLVLHAPGIVDRSALAQAGWSGTTSDESIEQAITGLRKELSKRDGIACIETVPGGGYRFVAPLERREPDRPLALLGADGDGLQAFVQGRDGVATLNQGPIADNDVRHWLRLAHVGWKGERIAAAEKMRALRPDLAVACWLQATVYVALGALEPALTVLHAGCAAQDRQRDFPSDYPAVGLHLLRGLV